MQSSICVSSTREKKIKYDSISSGVDHLLLPPPLPVVLSILKVRGASSFSLADSKCMMASSACSRAASFSICRCVLYLRSSEWMSVMTLASIMRNAANTCERSERHCRISIYEKIQSTITIFPTKSPRICWIPDMSNVMTMPKTCVEMFMMPETGPSGSGNVNSDANSYPIGWNPVMKKLCAKRN